MVFFEHVFGESTATRIENHVKSLRLSAPNSGAENMHFRTTNRNTLLRPLSEANKKQIYSMYLMVRNIRTILQRNARGRTYITRQQLHRNFETDPRYGEAFMQIIYYIDTPKYTNGRVAAPGNRGQLLTSHGQTTKIFDPKRGHAVYFTPNETWHEVLPQTNSNQNVNVDRKMIVMMLYKPTTSMNVVSNQFRNYPRGFPAALRSFGGYTARGNVRISSQNENALSSMLRRKTNIKPAAVKRKRNNNNPATKRRRTGNTQI
jgi:hypothetical protein